MLIDFSDIFPSNTPLLGATRLLDSREIFLPTCLLGAKNHKFHKMVDFFIFLLISSVSGSYLQQIINIHQLFLLEFLRFSVQQFYSALHVY